MAKHNSGLRPCNHCGGTGMSKKSVCVKCSGEGMFFPDLDIIENFEEIDEEEEYLDEDDY